MYVYFLKLIFFLVRQLKVGSPKDATTNVGALVSKEHLAKVRKQTNKEHRQQKNKPTNQQRKKKQEEMFLKYRCKSVIQ